MMCRNQGATLDPEVSASLVPEIATVHPSENLW